VSNIAAISQGIRIPSTRFRLSQYADMWQHAGHSVEFFHARTSAYPPVEKWRRPLWGMLEMAHRFDQLNRINKADLVILQRELISTYYTLERYISAPLVLDVDDAIFLHRSGKAAIALAHKADRIVCGNQFLADYFSAYQTNIDIIPTAVDTERFMPIADSSERKVIGWSGSSGGFPYLYEMEDALREVLTLNPDWKLLITSDKKPNFRWLNEQQVEFIPWSPDNEVACIQAMSIGLMPLQQSAWAEGKCSYKMLLYMACGIPVAVSPFGMNAEILAQGSVGIAATSSRQWRDGLNELIADKKLRVQMGTVGRALVDSCYSLQACNPSWQKVFAAFGS